MLLSGVQQSDSVMHIHVSILFQIIFPFRLLWSIEQSSLTQQVSCWLSILYFYLFKKCLEYDCFIMLCYLLQYSKANQLYIYIYPLFFGFPCHLNRCVTILKWREGSRERIFFSHKANIKLLLVVMIMNPSFLFNICDFWSVFMYITLNITVPLLHKGSL